LQGSDARSKAYEIRATFGLAFPASPLEEGERTEVRGFKLHLGIEPVRTLTLTLSLARERGPSGENPN
jgi:hypothetical protein